jgi:hypothetical protein
MADVMQHSGAEKQHMHEGIGTRTQYAHGQAEHLQTGVETSRCMTASTYTATHKHHVLTRGDMAGMHLRLPRHRGFSTCRFDHRSPADDKNYRSEQGARVRSALRCAAGWQRCHRLADIGIDAVHCSSAMHMHACT